MMVHINIIYMIGLLERNFICFSILNKKNILFAKMHPVQITSRDGLELVSYLTLPRWLDKGAVRKSQYCLVQSVHGGPNSRDNKGQCYSPNGLLTGVCST